MTIFDIKPYSYWRQRHRQAHDVWLVTCGDTPRTVLRLEMLHLINERQRQQIDTLTRENASLRTQHQHLVAEYMKLLALSSEVALLIAQIGDAAPTPDERLRLHPSLAIPNLME